MGYSGKTFLPYKWLLFLETLKEDKKLGIHLIILVSSNKDNSGNILKEYLRGGNDEI